jgi:hypothetical protein
VVVGEKLVHKPVYLIQQVFALQFGLKQLFPVSFRSYYIG